MAGLGGDGSSMPEDKATALSGAETGKILANADE